MSKRKCPSAATRTSGGRIQQKPNVSEHRVMIRMFQAGRYAEAEAQALRATSSDLHDAVAWKILGSTYVAQGKLALAQPALEKAARLSPNDADIFNNLGVLYKSLGNVEQAENDFRRAVELDPGLAGAYYNLSNIMKLRGRFSDAEQYALRALAIRPNYADAHNSLGAVFKEQGRLRDAAASLQEALRLQPSNALAMNNLGLVFKEMGNLQNAEAYLQRSVALNPNLPEARLNLGSVLKELGKSHEAESSLRHALRLQPDFVEALNELGNVQTNMGNLEAAESSFQRVLEIKPDYEDVFSNLLFCLNYHPNKSAEDIYAKYEEYEQKFGAPLRATWQAFENDRIAERRLRVGYVSPDFRQHSIRHFVEPLLARHNKVSVEVFAYAEVPLPDHVTTRYQSYVDHWVPTTGMSDENLAARIRTDGIDILVDLAGQTAKNRLGVFARKPAPVSVSWLGYGYTTGLQAIDYYLTDAISAPIGSDHLFSESVWRMPTPAYVFRPASNMGLVGSLPALEMGYVTLGTLSRAVRINHRTIKVWSEILRQLPESRLIVDSLNFSDQQSCERLAQEFALHGIARERLEIGFHSPPGNVFRRVDIGLDCFPHNSGTTLFETLFMGVPYVTLAGRPSVGRLGSSILHGVGHSEWIASTEGEYVEKVVALASDLPKLAALRARLRGEMESSPLMDEAGFAHKVETAYRAMFASWCGRTELQTNQDKNQTKPAQPAASDKKAILVETSVDAPSFQDVQAIVSLHKQGRPKEMEVLSTKLTVRFPNHAFGWKALGAALRQQDRIDEALRPMIRAAELLPEDAEAHNNLGTTLRAIGRLAEAETSLRRALELQPNYAEAHYNLGRTFNEKGLLSDSEASYRRALTYKSDYIDAHSDLGLCLFAQRRWREAEDSFRRSLAINPNHGEAHINLALTLAVQGKSVEAEASCRRGLEIRPENADAHNLLAGILKADGRLVEAAVSLRRTLELKPDYAQVHSNLSTTLAYLSDFSNVVLESDVALQLKPDEPVIWDQRLYSFSYHPDLTAEEIYAEFARWGDRFPDPVVDFSAHDRTPGRRLRIGYVSPDFRRHTSRFYFWPLFASHDHAVVELYAYSNVKIEDDFTRKFKGVFDHWRSIRGVADSEVARMIRQDGIDVLVDCCNHMLDDRLGVFTLKPAPIQATWLGAAWTSGLKMIDYALIDPHMAPDGTLTRETIVRLPHCFVAYQPPEETALISEPPFLKNGYITFGYSGRTERLNHHTFRVWGEILRRNPTARLILDFRQFADPPTQAHYREFMFRHGMDPSRVIMRNSANIFEGLNDIDILLDSFPHSGGTMLFDALWMGVPVLTLASRPPVGRIGTSLMINLGLPEWVAETYEEYIDKAGVFANNPQTLAELRAGMRDRMRKSPLMDGIGFARGMEAAYRQMYEKWCLNRT